MMNDRPRKRFYQADYTDDPTNPSPSRVVHVRNLNTNFNEADLIDALSTFGTISYVACIPNKQMALVSYKRAKV
jgi:RNA recognition motif-containing protein